MTAQEQQLLQGLTDRINKTPLDEKDPQAEQYLRDTLGRNPDALYILAQTVLVQQYALDQAQKQIADLKTQVEEAQQQAQQPKHTTSFLGGLFGAKDDPAPPPPPQQTPYQPVQQYPRAGSFAANQQYGAPPPPPPQYQQQYAPPYVPPQPQYGQPQYGQPQYGQPQYGQPQPQSGGFLRSAMTTAAGVAAGAIAFEGIESLMHGFGDHAGYGGGRGMGDFGGGGQGPREEVINKYYGDSSPSEHHSAPLSSDIEDRRNDRQQFANTDTSDTPTEDDDNNDFADTSSNDDSGSDDDNGDFSSDDNSN